MGLHPEPIASALFLERFALKAQNSCAALLGVDSCPLGGFESSEFDRLLGLTAQGYAAVVCCALGYLSADDKHAAPPKVRFPIAELVKTVQATTSSPRRRYCLVYPHRGGGTDQRLSGLLARLNAEV